MTGFAFLAFAGVLSNIFGQGTNLTIKPWAFNGFWRHLHALRFLVFYMEVPVVYWSLTADPLQTLNRERFRKIHQQNIKNMYVMVSVAEFLHDTSQPGRMQFAIAPSTRSETCILPSDPRTPPGHCGGQIMSYLEPMTSCPRQVQFTKNSEFSLRITLRSTQSKSKLNFWPFKAAISWLALPKFREENFSWHAQTGKPQDYKFCIVPEASSKEKKCIKCRKWEVIHKMVRKKSHAKGF